MVVVYAAKGPLAGRQVDLPDDQVDAATAEGGWALKIEPGAQLLSDPGAPYDEKWVIPGYTTEDLRPFTKKDREADKASEAKPAAGAGNTPQSASSSKTTAAPTASAPKPKADNGDGDDAAADKPKSSPSTK